MQGLTAAIYNHSPIWFQETLMAMHSRRQERGRRGGRHRRFLHEFCRNQWLDADALRRWRLQRFREAFSEIGREVPYYRQLFEKHRFDPATLTDFAQLRDLPFLEKQQLQEQFDDFLHPRRKPVYFGKTGGTTGKPLLSPADAESMQYSYALMDRFFMSAGCRFDQRSIYLGVQPVVPPHARSRFWRMERVTNTLFMSLRHMSDQTLPLYYEKIKQFQPYWIRGVGSFVHEVARWIIANDLAGTVPLAAVFPTSESLTDRMRSDITTAFATRLFDHYGSTEAVPLITQCPAGRYHIVPESGYVEFLRPDGSPADPGEPAEMVMTSFRQMMRPLLRYRVLDTASYNDEPCPCGRHWRTVEKIHGRLAEWIITRHGHRISLLGDLIFKDGTIPGITEMQIIQETADRFTFKIVKTPDWPDDAERQLVRRMEDIMGHDVHIDYAYVDAIPRTPAGKRRIVISKVTEQTGLNGRTDATEPVEPD